MWSRPALLALVVHAAALTGLVLAGAGLGQAIAILALFYLALLPVGVLVAAFIAPLLGPRVAAAAALLGALLIAWSAVLYTGADPEVVEGHGIPDTHSHR